MTSDPTAEAPAAAGPMTADDADKTIRRLDAHLPFTDASSDAHDWGRAHGTSAITGPWGDLAAVTAECFGAADDLDAAHTILDGWIAATGDTDAGLIGQHRWYEHARRLAGDTGDTDTHWELLRRLCCRTVAGLGAWSTVADRHSIRIATATAAPSSTRPPPAPN